MSAAGSQIIGGTRASSGCRFPRTIPLAGSPGDRRQGRWTSRWRRPAPGWIETRCGSNPKDAALRVTEAWNGSTTKRCETPDETRSSG